MGYKVEQKSSESHPTGWFLFCIASCEPIESEFKNKKTSRFKWEVESSERKTDGDRFKLGVYTGRDMVDDERCKLKQLVEACGLDAGEFEDTDELIGKIFAGKVQVGEGDKSGYANIVAYDTRDRCRPAASTAKPKVKAKASVQPAEPEFNDPFADE